MIKTVLAFDYGDKRIGVAVGQTLTRTASPVASVQVLRSGPDWGDIARMVRDWHPQVLVVGLPLNMDGTEQPVSTAARRFKRELEARFRLPTHFMDERLSTRAARERLYLQGKVDGDDDPVAAQIILEGWLADGEGGH